MKKNNLDWSIDPYPDYEKEINSSIAFSGLEVDFFTKGKAEYFLSMLSENFSDPMKISCLDIGCGIGNIHPYLKNNLGQLSGVDVSAEAIQQAQNTNPWVHYQTYDGITLPYMEASFDVCYAICVMHHVPPEKWSMFIEEALRVLKPGGILQIFEHNPYNPLTQLAVKRCPFDKDAVLLTAKKVKSLMSSHSFLQIHNKYIFFTPFKSQFIRSLENKISWLPLGAQYYVCGVKPK